MLGVGTLIRGAVLAVVAVVLSLLPFTLSDYHVGEGARVAVYFMAILSLNLALGYAGQISLGQGAFMLVGAYTTGILNARHGWTIIETLPVVFLLSFALGALLGLPALRLSGIYLALVTLGFAFAMPQLPLKFDKFFGGRNGFQFTTRSNLWAYGVGWTCAALLFVGTWWLLRGRVGRAFRAIRDSEIAAASSGVSLPIYKVLAFALSGGIAGVAGTMFVIVSNSFVGPTAFQVLLSLRILIGAAVAGFGSLWGLIVGAAFIALLPDVSHSVPVVGSTHGQDVVYGVLVILIMFLLPGGFAGLLRQLILLATRGKRAAQATPSAVEAA